MTAVSPAPAGLIGREAELEVLYDLVDRVREREGARVLVVQGEPGVGKTSLLAAARERAGSMGVQVLATAGTHAEMDLPFSGLHQLLLPLLGDLDRLAERQREALAGAFGLGTDTAPDRFLVGLAVLSLLSEAARKRPVLCAIDDEQWLDRSSAQALAFVARRLSADSVALLFAATEPGDELGGLAELVVEGLGEGEARELLASVVPGRLDERVRERIVAETRGNPLALLELPRGLTPAELAGGFGLPAAATLAGRIEESFLRRLKALPADAQVLVLVAAAEPTGDPALLWRSADRLGIAYGALAPAADAGLLDVGARVRFRHPLVRSAVYRMASPARRRHAHGVLADVTDADVDPDRRA